MAESSSNCRWQRRKEERPAEILAAALKIFAEKGFTATKLDEVAKAAGVSKGTIYLYFDSKEAIFKAVVVEYVLPKISEAEHHAEHYNGPIKDFLIQLVEQWWLNVGQSDLGGLPKLIIAEAGNFPELAKFYLENVIQRMRHFIANLIELGIERGEFRQCDSKYVARLFLAPMVFAAIWERSLAQYDESYDVKQYLDTHLDIFLRGLQKDKDV